MVPDEVKPWAHVLTAALTDGDVGIRRAIRSRTSDELEHLTQVLKKAERLMPHLLRFLDLPQLRGPGFWSGAVLPAIQKELARRRAPHRPPATGRIASLKAKLRLEDLAAKFTDLRPAGLGKVKGLCPMHQEREASFFVYIDSQRWQCFGACAIGGDVIDLFHRLGGVR